MDVARKREWVRRWLNSSSCAAEVENKKLLDSMVLEMSLHSKQEARRECCVWFLPSKCILIFMFFSFVFLHFCKHFCSFPLFIRFFCSFIRSRTHKLRWKIEMKCSTYSQHLQRSSNFKPDYGSCNTSWKLSIYFISVMHNKTWSATANFKNLHDSERKRKQSNIISFKKEIGKSLVALKV